MVKTRQKKSQQTHGTIERVSCQLKLLKAAGVKYAAYIINEILMFYKLRKNRGSEMTTREMRLQLFNGPAISRSLGADVRLW